MKKLLSSILLICALAVSALAQAPKGESNVGEVKKINKEQAKADDGKTPVPAFFTIKDMEQRLEELKKNRENMIANINALNGAIQVTEAYINELKTKSEAPLKPVEGIVEPAK